MRAALLLALVALLAIAGPALGQGLTLQVLRHPDVVVTTDYQGQEYTTPRYLFSVETRVTNGNAQRNVVLHAVAYLDRSVEGCPERTSGVRPAHLFSKNLQLDPREVVEVGGLTTPEAGRDRAYWPLEVYRRYPDPSGETAQNPEGEHGFCVLALASGEDSACDKPAEQVCTLASAPFRAYVRHTNSAPEIASVEALPERPRPGQEVLFRAAGEDADTVPRPDRLTYAWDVGTEELSGPVARHAFGVPGRYEVVLSVTDGFETVERRLNVTVEGEPVSPPADGNGTPMPVIAVPICLAVAALAVRARRR